MVASLSDYADLLYFQPKVPDSYFKTGYEKQAVLLPMKACKVLVPYPKDNALNLFQETILKLMNCGKKEEAWLADNLSLDQSLVETVIRELYEKKLITKSGTLTEEGTKILEDKSLSYDMKTGYIFYDYLTKTYIDAFIPDNRFRPSDIRSRKKDANQIQFFLDSTDPNSRYESAIIINAEKPEAPVKPSPYDALKVCRRQKNRDRQMFAGNFTQKNDEEVTDFMPNDKVSLLNDNKDVYVATYLVIPVGEDIVNRNQMQVVYPFGKGFSPLLVDPINTAANYPENKPLMNAIDELKKKQTALTESEKYKNITFDKQTIKRVDEIFSDNIRNHPYANKRAIEAETKREQIFGLIEKNKGKNWETINSNINDYVIAIYRLLGAALIDVSDKYSYYRNLLNSDIKHNADTLREIAIGCGFTYDDVYEKYLQINKGSVTGTNNSAGAKQSEQVRALIALNLLEAKYNTDHPFYKLAQADPMFIVDAYDLTRIRDDGMHGNDIVYNFNHIDNLSKKFFRAVSLILEDLSFNEDHFELKEVTSTTDMIGYKHRLSALQQVEKMFTKNINLYRGLTNKLVELIEEQTYGEEFLTSSADGKMSKTGESYPTYAAETLEFILKELCKRRIERNAVRKLKNYSDEYSEELSEQMRAYGFSVNSIPYYSLSKISQSFRNYSMGTLQSNFYVWYFSETEQPDNLLPKLAEKSPAFIQVISDTVNARSHTGIMSYSDSSLDFIKNHLIECINQVIDLMAYRGLY